MKRFNEYTIAFTIIAIATYLSYIITMSLPNVMVTVLAMITVVVLVMDITVLVIKAVERARHG